MAPAWKTRFYLSAPVHSYSERKPAIMGGVKDSRDSTDILPALIIGFGSTLRGDDGVGLRVVELLEAECLSGVETVSCHQLTPELADPISRARLVIFVDAAVDVSNGRVRVEPVDPAPVHQVMVHTVSPPTLLHLAESVFGHCPPAWTVAIPVANMGIGEHLSPFAESGAQTARLRIMELLRSGAS